MKGVKQQVRVPFVREAEQAVLGAAIVDPKAVLPQLEEKLRSEHFYLRAHRLIYEALVERFENSQPIDIITLGSHLEEKGILAEVGGRSYLSELVSAVTTTTSVPYYVDIIITKAFLRELGQVGSEIKELSEKSDRGIAELFDEAQNMLAALRDKLPQPSLNGAGDFEPLKDFLTREIEETPNLIEPGVVPKSGSLIIGGRPKLGKSIKAANVGLAVTAGLPVLRLFETHPARVLYVQHEITEPFAQRRLRLMLDALPHDKKGLAERHFYHKRVTDVQLNKPEGIAWFKHALEIVQPDLLIIDPISKFHTLDENKTRDMIALTDALDKLRGRYNCAILLVHHHAKPSALHPREGGQLLRGSSVLDGWVDSHFTLTRDKDMPKGHVRLSFTFRNAAEPDPIVIAFDPHTLWFEVVGKPTAEPSPWEVRMALIDLGGKARYSDLLKTVMDRCGIKETRAKKLLRQTLEAGAIKRDEDGNYVA